MTDQFAIYWFRNDLRLHDNPALINAITQSHQLIPVYCHDSQQHELNRWGFPRCSALRQQFIFSCLDDLAEQIKHKKSCLVELLGNPVEEIYQLCQQFQIKKIYCEDIQAPEETAQVEALRDLGIQVISTWQSSLLAPEDLPFKAHQVDDVFTKFRITVEKNTVIPKAEMSAPNKFPALPEGLLAKQTRPHIDKPKSEQINSSFPFQSWDSSGETQAMHLLKQYFSGEQAKRYKQTRNQLTGWHYSTKFSPWLAIGALSPRTIYHALKQYEAEFGESDGSYWIWFELLWRDYFRFLHIKYGRRLYLATGLKGGLLPQQNINNFQRWREANCGNRLIDAAMRELQQTGFLSNRLRQIVASFLIYDLRSDWRMGAAWFEAQLLDYDVYSNQGNWLYIAGYGTDPRGGRRFDVNKQCREYDPHGDYQKSWLNP